MQSTGPHPQVDVQLLSRPHVRFLLLLLFVDTVDAEGFSEGADW